MNITDTLRKAVSLGLTAIERDDEETIEQLEIMGKEILPNFLKKPVSP